MDLAWISLGALLAVVVASCATRLNPGVLAIVLAWGVAGWAAPYYQVTLGLRDVLAGFPVDLFLTLVGVTLLFTQAQLNGTLDRVTHAAVRLCRGNPGLIPVLFCLLAAGLASVGAGNIAASALLSPLAMAAADRARIPALLMAVLVTHGAIAGGLSPFSPTGVIADTLLRDRLHLAGFEWQVYAHNLVANLAVALGGYTLLGGWRLALRGRPDQAVDQPAEEPPVESLRGAHRVTLGVIGLVIVAAVGLGAPVGMAALAGAVVLAGLGCADEAEAIRKLPWGVLLMVCGVTVLTALLEKTGGADRLVHLIGRVSTERTVTGVAALLSGLISVYSSTSGVVLPAFLPLVPGLSAEVGGDPLALASSIIIGGHLVDSSPLSTVGALCIACAGPNEDRRALFNRLLLWGLAMAVVGAVGCALFF